MDSKKIIFGVVWLALLTYMIFVLYHSCKNPKDDFTNNKVIKEKFDYSVPKKTRERFVAPLTSEKPGQAAFDTRQDDLGWIDATDSEITRCDSYRLSLEEELGRHISDDLLLEGIGKFATDLGNEELKKKITGDVAIKTLNQINELLGANLTREDLEKEKNIDKAVNGKTHEGPEYDELINNIKTGDTPTRREIDRVQNMMRNVDKVMVARYVELLNILEDELYTSEGLMVALEDKNREVGENIVEIMERCDMNTDIKTKANDIIQERKKQMDELNALLSGTLKDLDFDDLNDLYADLPTDGSLLDYNLIDQLGIGSSLSQMGPRCTDVRGEVVSLTQAPDIFGEENFNLFNNATTAQVYEGINNFGTNYEIDPTAKYNPNLWLSQKRADGSMTADSMRIDDDGKMSTIAFTEDKEDLGDFNLIDMNSEDFGWLVTSDTKGPMKLFNRKIDPQNGLVRRACKRAQASIDEGVESAKQEYADLECDALPPAQTTSTTTNA